MTQSIIASSIVLVLGAVDPEMMALERFARSLGVTVTPGVSGGKRVIPPSAYKAEDVALPEGGGVRIWAEARPTGMTRADLEARGDFVADHHFPGDRGFGLPAERAVEAATITQVLAHLRELGLEFEIPRDLVVVAAIDHKLDAALAGLVPGITADEAVMNHAKWWEDEELATLLNRKTIELEEVLAGIARDRATMIKCPRRAIGGGHHEFVDLTGCPGGTLQWAPAASCLERLPALALQSDGHGAKVVTLGFVAPEAAMAFKRAAKTLIDEAAAQKVEWALHARKGTQDGTGVYGDPARGMCGAYLPPEQVTNLKG